MAYVTKINVNSVDYDVHDATLETQRIQRNQLYASGAKMYSNQLPVGKYLLCTVSGTTGAEEPVISVTATHVVDGSSEWDVKEFGTGGGGGSGGCIAAEVERLTAYVEGDIRHSPNQPSGYYLQCVDAGTTGATEPGWSTAKFISDGTVTWRQVKLGEAVIIETTDATTYSCPTLFESDKDKITIPAGLSVLIGTVFYATTVPVIINVGASANERAGKDIYIYACVPLGGGGAPDIVLSFNSTVPDGYTAENSRKIGGFHFLCVDAGASLTTKDFLGVEVDHPLKGYVHGDILPTSRWDLKHRPQCDPAGMAYVYEVDTWFSIYGMSWDGNSLVSEFNGVWADGTSAKKWHGEAFCEKLAMQKMRLPWRREFQMAAKGSNEQTNIQGSADPTTTGGHLDTAGRRIISSYGLEDCCGVLWQWLEDLGFTGGNEWTNSTYDGNVDPVNRGQSYGNLYRLLGGAAWADGASCGSRAAHCDHVSSSVTAYYGCRAAAEPLQKNVSQTYIGYTVGIYE